MLASHHLFGNHQQRADPPVQLPVNDSVMYDLGVGDFEDEGRLPRARSVVGGGPGTSPETEPGESTPRPSSTKKRDVVEAISFKKEEVRDTRSEPVASALSEALASGEATSSRADLKLRVYLPSKKRVEVMVRECCFARPRAWGFKRLLKLHRFLRRARWQTQSKRLKRSWKTRGLASDLNFAYMMKMENRMKISLVRHSLLCKTRVRLYSAHHST